jgi:hypothetical protein
MEIQCSVLTSRCRVELLALSFTIALSSLLTSVLNAQSTPVPISVTHTMPPENVVFDPTTDAAIFMNSDGSYFSLSATANAQIVSCGGNGGNSVGVGIAESTSTLLVPGVNGAVLSSLVNGGALNCAPTPLTGVTSGTATPVLLGADPANNIYAVSAVNGDPDMLYVFSPSGSSYNSVTNSPFEIGYYYSSLLSPMQFGASGNVYLTAAPSQNIPYFTVYQAGQVKSISNYLDTNIASPPVTALGTPLGFALFTPTGSKNETAVVMEYGLAPACPTTAQNVVTQSVAVLMSSASISSVFSSSGLPMPPTGTTVCGPVPPSIAPDGYTFYETPIAAAVDTEGQVMYDIIASISQSISTGTNTINDVSLYGSDLSKSNPYPILLGDLSTFFYPGGKPYGPLNLQMQFDEATAQLIIANFTNAFELDSYTPNATDPLSRIPNTLFTDPKGTFLPTGMFINQSNGFVYLPSADNLVAVVSPVLPPLSFCAPTSGTTGTAGTQITLIIGSSCVTANLARSRVSKGGRSSLTVKPNDTSTTPFTGTIHFTSSDPKAILPADYTFTASDDGSHTFDFTLFTAGSQTITFVDTSNSTITGTTAVTITAGEASDIAATAGTPQSTLTTTTYGSALTAQVTDPYSNPISGAVVTFSAPASGPSGTFAGGGLTAASATGSNGVATAPAFTANSTAGSFQVTATTPDVSAPAAFNLTNTAPATIGTNTAVNGPSTLVYGTAGSYTILVTAASGNVVPTGTVAYKVTTSSTTAASGNLTLAGGTASIPISGLPAGMYTVSASYTPASGSGFMASQGSATFTTTLAVLTVTAVNQSRVYGAANPTFTDTVSGFVNGDTSSVVSGTATETTTATGTSVPGSYPISFSTESLTATNYTFTYVNGTLSVTAAAQTITFGAFPNVTYGVGPITLGASASSSLPVSYAVTGPATVAGSTLTITGAGLVTVTASQAGNTDYAAATPVSQPFTVNQASQTVTFNTIPAQVAGTSIPLTASATSGLMVSFTSLSTGVCTVAGTTATLLTAGTCTIQASQGGNANYTAATVVSESFTVSSGASFTITPIPPAETIRRGVLGVFILELKSLDGFNGEVRLSCDGGPEGSKCTDFPMTVKVNGTAYALSGILFPQNTVPGSYTITFTGVSGALTNTATAKFTVE